MAGERTVESMGTPGAGRLGWSYNCTPFNGAQWEYLDKPDMSQFNP